MTAYYNEFHGPTAAWLRELIARGLIASGEVDERSIEEVSPSDLRGFTQCHFFAGIGGWSYALRLAGWPDDRPVWTGSPPCQPFSAAGKRKGAADDRHLWPVYFRLISEHRPATVFGEQVGAAIGNGWLDAVLADMESEGYACAAAVLPASCVGAPHARHRLWTVASMPNADSMRSQRERQETSRAWREQQFAGLLQDLLRISVPTGTSGGVVDGLSGDLAYSRPTALKAFGNAIVPQVAAEVIGSFMEIQDERR